LKLIREALDASSLSADQQGKVTALRDAFHARHQKTESAQQAFRSALADQIAAGTIDRAKLKPQLDALAAIVAANQKDNLAAFTSLHDLLDSKQRNTFVDFIESHGPQHGGMDAGEGHPHGGLGFHGGFGPLKEWRTLLNLTDAQVQQIRQAMRDKLGRDGHKEFFKHFEAIHAQLEAFRADSFTPDGTLFSFDKMSDHMLTLAEIAEPILTPEQRQLAAQKVREMPHWHFGDAGK
jgi:Spy/CpxP family protein refolding chaperone